MSVICGGLSAIHLVTTNERPLSQHTHLHDRGVANQREAVVTADKTGCIAGVYLGRGS